jgi:hypothetical protein
LKVHCIGATPLISRAALTGLDLASSAETSAHLKEYMLLFRMGTDNLNRMDRIPYSAFVFRIPYTVFRIACSVPMVSVAPCECPDPIKVLSAPMGYGIEQPGYSKKRLYESS